MTVPMINFDESCCSWSPTLTLDLQSSLDLLNAIECSVRHARVYIQIPLNSISWAWFSTAVSFGNLSRLSRKEMTSHGNIKCHDKMGNLLIYNSNVYDANTPCRGHSCRPPSIHRFCGSSSIIWLSSKEIS